MANSYFQFKQFTIYHDRCGMKVGTDGVLLGAWVNLNDADSALDIGVGSGLVALMMAQRNKLLKIDAIDIDEIAVEQAKENIIGSPFSKRINCFPVSLQNFERQCEKKYDVIISNPPFFIESLKSPFNQRTLARHTDSLPIEELMSLSAKLLSNKGRLSIIFPFEHKKLLINLSLKHGFHTLRITNVYPTPQSQAKRVLLEFSKARNLFSETDIVIEKERHVYSDDFKELVSDFYLKL